MGNPLVPVKTFNVVRTRIGVSQSERTIDVVQIGNEKLETPKQGSWISMRNTNLAFRTSSSEEVGMSGVEL